MYRFEELLKNYLFEEHLLQSNTYYTFLKSSFYKNLYLCHLFLEEALKFQLSFNRKFWHFYLASGEEYEDDHDEYEDEMESYNEA